MMTAREHQVPEAMYQCYLAALLEGDSREICSIVNALIDDGLSIIQVYRDFIQRGLYEVGVLWEQNKIQVSVEHLAASATELVLSELFLKSQGSKRDAPEAIIACVAGELHDVGAMVLANIFEESGWKSLLLGANTPMRDLLVYLGQRKRLPRLLALSVTLPANRPSLEDNLKLITSQFPRLDILIGGQALAGSDDARRYRDGLLSCYPTVSHVESLEALRQFLSERLAPAISPTAEDS